MCRIVRLEQIVSESFIISFILIEIATVIVLQHFDNKNIIRCSTSCNFKIDWYRLIPKIFIKINDPNSLEKIPDFKINKIDISSIKKISYKLSTILLSTNKIIHKFKLISNKKGQSIKQIKIWLEQQQCKIFYSIIEIEIEIKLILS